LKDLLIIAIKLSNNKLVENMPGMINYEKKKKKIKK